MPVKYKMPVFVLGYTKYDYSQLCTRFVRCDEGRALVTSGGRVAHYAPGQKRDAFLWTARLQHITRPIGATMHNNPPPPPPTYATGPITSLGEWKTYARERNPFFSRKKEIFHCSFSFIFPLSSVNRFWPGLEVESGTRKQISIWMMKVKMRDERTAPLADAGAALHPPFQIF